MQFLRFTSANAQKGKYKKPLNFPATWLNSCKKLIKIMMDHQFFTALDYLRAYYKLI